MPLSRRDFIRAASVSTATLALASPSLARAPRDEPKTLRIGLVGCGGRGTGAAIQALLADRNVALWSVADAFPERIDPCLANIADAMKEKDAEGGGDVNQRKIQVAPERRFVGLEAYRQLLDSGVDVVCLCTPPVFRPAQFVDAVDKGVHIFCEKPVAIDGPGLRAVLNASRKAKEKALAVMSGFCWRYSTRERETYRKIGEGAIGDIVAVYTNYNATGWIQPKPRRPEWSDVEFQVRNWHYFHWISGDHIVEQAVHAIDKLHWAMNAAQKPGEAARLPQRVTAVGGRQCRPNVPETGNVYDHFALVFDYDNGVRGFHMCRHWPNSPSDNSDYVLGSKGTATVNGWNDTHVITGPNAWKCETPKNDMYQQEHDELFASIRSGKPVNDGQRMCESTLLAIMGRMAAYTGQVVTWEQAMNSQENLLPPKWEWTDRPTPTVAVPGTTKVA